MRQDLFPTKRAKNVGVNAFRPSVGVSNASVFCEDVHVVFDLAGLRGGQGNAAQRSVCIGAFFGLDVHNQIRSAICLNREALDLTADLTLAVFFALGVHNRVGDFTQVGVGADHKVNFTGGIHHQ